MKKMLLLTFAFFLGAAINPLSGRDGYIFRKKEFFIPTIEVTVVPHKTRQELVQVAKREGVIIPSGEKLMAYSLVKPEQRKCTIHLIDPDIRYEPEYIGHELVHCFYGSWHD